eukprot:GFYU01009721.1.p1 GENE.GFYU01009721.1~~GFYU01009721.1.p1  ORF type:complete len:163 (+),score=4.55 GFYU01009721.1:121-609(+)
MGQCVAHPIDALVKAVEEGDVNKAEKVIEKYSDMAINDPNLIGEVPLVKAAGLSDVKTSLKMVSLLLRHGADPNILDEFGDSSLLKAVAANHPGNVKLLLQHGAEVNTQERNGRTGLHIAGRNKYWSIVSILMEFGADETITDKWGYVCDLGDYVHGEMYLF